MRNSIKKSAALSFFTLCLMSPEAAAVLGNSVNYFRGSKPEKIKDAEVDLGDCNGHVSVYNLGKSRFSDKCTVPEALGKLFEIPFGTEQIVVMDARGHRQIVAYGNTANIWKPGTNDFMYQDIVLIDDGEKMLVQRNEEVNGPPLSAYTTHPAGNFLGRVENKCHAYKNTCGGIDSMLFNMDELILGEQNGTN